ncbi:MAG: hypothetical protein E6F99_09840 [Actinobacteria bacterium]|nr:MAG: hypothetical protein E6F99_09840 [Actinomycetota bacterium]
MTTNGKPPDDRPAEMWALVLRRAPVRQATVVRSDLAHTFDTFARTMSRPPKGNRRRVLLRKDRQPPADVPPRHDAGGAGGDDQR